MDFRKTAGFATPAGPASIGVINTRMTRLNDSEKCSGARWTRTTDLILIRDAL